MTQPPDISTSTAFDRDGFSAEELAIVLSHYDIGPVEAVAEFARGSRRAPKLLITAEQGRFMLKRRAKRRDDPYKVAFCHALQLQLAHQHFPLPHLIGTQRGNNSMLQVRGHVYELFEYVPGQPYPHSNESTQDSGRVLSLFHKLLQTFRPEWQSPVGSYHAAASVQTAVGRLPSVLAEAKARSGKASPSDLPSLISDLGTRYQQAGAEVEKAGISAWPGQITHADWHPGNMLFRDDHVVAVIDYDSARLLPRAIDVANGALQFSIIGGEDDVATWPDHLDEERFRKFTKGYDSVQMLSEAELTAIPWLMIEALIAEAVLTICPTGTFGRLEGATFLRMVQQKSNWLRANAHRLMGLARAG